MLWLNMALALFFAIHLAEAQETAYPPEGCPSGWINSLEGCFLFHYTKNLTWREAQEECERLGGFLAEIKSEEQAVLLTSIAYVQESITGVHSWWIGLTDQGHEGRWMWQHSATDPHYTNWAPNSPDNTKNEQDCARMDSSDAFEWSDVECGGLLASAICQRETNGTEGTTTIDTLETTTTDTTTTAYSTHVELRGGDGYSYGNVFAVNSNGYMGPVCDDDWDENAARVVCRQLGFSGGQAFLYSFWGEVPVDFAMDDVVCTGNETTIQQCTYTADDDCAHVEGAGVECYTLETTTIDTLETTTIDTLETTTIDAVETTTTDTWETTTIDAVETTTTDTLETTTIDAVGTTTTDTWETTTTDTWKTTTTDTWETTTTDTWETTTTTAYETHVELRGGDGYSNGNVFAVNSNGYLGPVCDDLWTSTKAGIVCRQLGFTRGKAFTLSHWGEVPTDFAMDDVYCFGNEATIQECAYYDVDNCESSEGAGVECY